MIEIFGYSMLIDGSHGQSPASSDNTAPAPTRLPIGENQPGLKQRRDSGRMRSGIQHELSLLCRIKSINPLKRISCYAILSSVSFLFCSLIDPDGDLNRGWR